MIKKGFLVFLLLLAVIFCMGTFSSSATEVSAKTAYNSVDKLSGYLENNLATYQYNYFHDASNSTVWVGDDLAIWSNNAYEEYLDKLGDDSYYAILGNHDFNFDFLNNERYSGREYYFFSKEAINDQIEVLSLIKTALEAEDNSNIQTIHVIETTTSVGIYATGILITAAAWEVMVPVMIVVEGAVLLNDIFSSNYQSNLVIVELNTVIATLDGIRQAFIEGQEVAILQEDYVVKAGYYYEDEYNYQFDIRTNWFKIEKHYRNSTSIPNYENIYFQLSDDNKEIYLNDVNFAMGDKWGRAFPAAINGQIEGNLIFVKDVTYIDGESYSTLDEGLDVELSYYDEYDWYSFEISSVDDAKVILKEFGGTFQRPINIELYDENYNWIATSSLSSYYPTPTSPWPLQQLTINHPTTTNSTYNMRVKAFPNSGDTWYTEPYKLEFDIVTETYQMQWYNPQYSYVWSFVSSVTGTSPYFSSGTTIYSGDYKYVYTTSIPEYKYDYTKYQYYDKFTMVIKRKDILWGCDACDADDTIVTYNWYENEAPSLKTSLPYDLVYTNSTLATSYVFPSSSDGFTYGGRYIHYNDSSLSNGDYYLATYTKYDDNITHLVGTYTTAWSTSTLSDGKSGDYYYDYYNQQVQFRSTMTTYIKSYTAAWVNTSTFITIGAYDTLPTLSSSYRWVRIYP